jgi:hypothetical protein
MAVAKQLCDIAFVSIGEKTPSRGFTFPAMKEATKAGFTVHHIDCRKWLPRNPRDEEQILHDLDGTSPITQRCVLSQEGFVALQEAIVCKAAEKSRIVSGMVFVLECTSGGHRAFTASEVGAELLNGIAVEHRREFNAMHFPMAWLMKRGQLQSAWNNALEWASNAWIETKTPPADMESKFGYAGAVQRKQSFQVLTRCWDIVRDFNEEYAREQNKWEEVVNLICINKKGVMGAIRDNERQPANVADTNCQAVIMFIADSWFDDFMLRTYPPSSSTTTVTSLRIGRRMGAIRRQATTTTRTTSHRRNGIAASRRRRLAATRRRRPRLRRCSIGVSCSRLPRPRRSIQHGRHSNSIQRRGCPS